MAWRGLVGFTTIVKACLPPDPYDEKLRFHHRMVLYVAFLAGFVGIYSLIKWNSMGR